MDDTFSRKEHNLNIRIDYLDIAKFIGIFLVILGHTTGNDDNPFFRIIIYAFHMPLFFIISGLVVKPSNDGYGFKHWAVFLIKNFLALVVPYLIWALIYSQFSFNIFPNLFYASWETIAETKTATSLWFLPCLFVVRIIVEIVLMLSSYSKIINSHLFAFIIAGILFTSGFLIPHPIKGLPWCIDIALVSSGFALFGYAFKSFFNDISEKPIWVHLIVMGVSLGIFVLGIAIQKDNLYLAILARAKYGNIPLFLSNSLSGSICILSISMIITRLFKNHRNNIVNHFMLWCGKNTMGIYLLHKNFLQEVCIASLIKWGVQLPNLGFGILVSIVALIFSCVLTFIIDKYIPQLFGKFSQVKLPCLKEKRS